MVLFGLLNRRPAREGTEPLPTPVAASPCSSFKSKLSGRREQPTEESTAFNNTRVSSHTTPNEARHQEPSFFRQAFEPNLELTSPHLPATRPRHSMDHISLGSRAESSGSSRPATPSSEASSSLSKYNYMFFAPLRASMVDDTGSVEHESLLLESQEDDDADHVVESSLPQAPFVPLDPAAAEAPVSLVKGINRSSTPEYEPTCALECFIASSPYGGDDISACLRVGSAAKSRRIAFHREDTPATTNSGQPAKNPLDSEDVDTLNVTDATLNHLQPANTGNKSASDESQPSPSVAPVVTSLSQETSSQAPLLSTLSLTGRAYNRRQIVDRTKNQSASSEARPSLTVAPLLPVISSRRMVIVAPKLTPIRELVSEDYPESLRTSSSSRGDDEENNVLFNSQDLMDRTFATSEPPPSPVAPVVTPLSQETSSGAPPLSTFSLTGRAYNRRQIVDRTKNQSARSEARPSLTVAPLLPAVSSHRMVIVAPKLTPIRELVSEEYPESLSTSSSSRRNDEENNVLLKSQDFADRTIATAKSRSSRVTGPVTHCDRRITTEANASASSEDVASPTAAPIGSTPLSHRQSAQAPGFTTFSTNGSAENNRQSLDGNRNESAGPSVADAPITSIPLSRLKPRKVVRNTAPPVWSQVSKHARNIQLRITLKLRQWGNGVSNVLRVRPRTEFRATGGRQAVRNGHSVAQDTKKLEYDPWLGYVPASESSLQIDINYGLADPWPVPTKPRVDLD